MTKRNAFLLVGALILVAALVFIFRERSGGVVLANNPCILENIPDNPPKTLCRDKCGETFNNFPEFLGTPGKYGCCPDGFELRGGSTNPHCVKK